MEKITLSPSWRADVGDFLADKWEAVLNYPIGCDLILSVRERDGRPAEICTARHNKFPLLVIFDPALIQMAKDCEREGARVMIDTKWPRGNGEAYVSHITRV